MAARRTHILERIRGLSNKQFDTEAQFIKACRLSPGYMANLQDRVEKCMREGKDPSRITIQLDIAARMARVLGVHIETIAGTDYVAGDRDDEYPNRYWAIEAARFIGLPELAIRAVGNEKPRHDLSRQTWFARIEAEATALRDRDSVVPLLPGKTAEQA